MNSKKPERFYNAKVDLKLASDGQKQLFHSIRENTVTICAGAAGTGKTWVTIGSALQALRSGASAKIVVARPIVESGERLGYLPGTVTDKINPYMIPIFDTIRKLVGKEALRTIQELDMLECVPLALMRGRTFDHTFMILDEAQNATIDQMKLFVTRAGTDAKLVICGDHRQSDLPGRNGLKFVMECLKDMDSVGIVGLADSEIIRNPIIGPILERMESAELQEISNRTRAAS